MITISNKSYLVCHSCEQPGNGCVIILGMPFAARSWREAGSFLCSDIRKKKDIEQRKTERGGHTVARMYKVSADTSEKEKIIGGILTIYQGGWIVLGIFISGGIFFLANILLPPILSLFIAVPPGTAFAVVFAFYKKEQLSFATYLLCQYAFRRKTKKLINTLTFKQNLKEQLMLFQ